MARRNGIMLSAVESESYDCFYAVQKRLSETDIGPFRGKEVGAYQRVSDGCWEHSQETDVILLEKALARIEAAEKDSQAVSFS